MNMNQYILQCMKYSRTLKLLKVCAKDHVITTLKLYIKF